MKGRKTRRELLALGIVLTASALSILLPVSGFRLPLVTAPPTDKELLDENETLRQELAQRRRELTEYLDCKEENERLRSLFRLQKQQPDHRLVPGEIIRRDAWEDFGGFLMNIGENQGVTINAPVVTGDGMVGVVTKTEGDACRVTTILSPAIKIAAVDRQSGDSGILSGTAALNETNQTALSALTETNRVVKGDLVVTSGGTYPEKLLIGTVAEVRFDAFNTDRVAVITPAVDIRQLTHAAVMLPKDKADE